MKSEGWMVNLAMRRVERVVRQSSPYNRLDYGKYQGPKRTYMLHNSQVHGTELEAMEALYQRMITRMSEINAKAMKYHTELTSVYGALKHMRAIK